VYGPDGVTLQTQANYSAVAVIFSPGSPLPSQTRNTAAQQNDPANYLDSVNGRNNAIANGPFIAGTVSSAFNDQLLLITTHDLIPLLEKRVAAVVKKALKDYYLASDAFPANRYYPWADVITSVASYSANAGTNRGWLPDVASTCCSPSTIDWVAGSPPQWFFDNQWYTLIYYSVAPSLTIYHSGLMLNVNGLAGRALFFMPGTYSGTRAIDILSEYLEDSQNNDNSNDTYITPTSKALDRDRIYWLSSSSIWNQ